MHKTPFAVALALVSASCLAADAPPAAPPSEASAPAASGGAPAEPRERVEPAVRQSTVEDDATRIDELRVRGRLQRIVVTSKSTRQSYEILTGDGARDLGESSSGTRGAAGKRVWNVLKF
jgi:hypothetical protein